MLFDFCVGNTVSSLCLIVYRPGRVTHFADCCVFLAKLWFGRWSVGLVCVWCVGVLFVSSAYIPYHDLVVSWLSLLAGLWWYGSLRMVVAAGVVWLYEFGRSGSLYM